MVNLVIENLLTTARNRALYQALWSLSLTKSCKPENLKSCENLSIAAICNELMLEMISREPDPNQFYLSAHLTFGVIELYRYQIDKLLKQAKNALTCCNLTFFEIDWLSRMSQTQQAEDSQHSFMLPIRTKKAPKKRSHGERDKKLLEAEIDLVENVLTIPDVPEVVMETWKNDSIDKTMARSAYDITINERFQSLTDEGFCSTIEDEFDEFGGAIHQEYETFFSSTTHQLCVANERDQEVPDLYGDMPDMLRSTENQISESPNYDLLESTISDEVMSIVRKQLPRKHSLSQAFDISERLERATKVAKLNHAFVDSNNISPFASDVNAIESVVNFEADALEIPLVTTSPADVKNPRKPRQKKRKLVIDKIKKLADKELKDNLEQYKENLTSQSPMETFEVDMMLVKHSADTFWTAPGSRLKFCAAKQLLPLFERSFKIIKNKRPQLASNEVEENSPPKKRKLRGRIVDYMEIDETLIVPELPVTEAVADGVSKLDMSVKKKYKKSESKKMSMENYQENEKWSKHKIMKILNNFWMKSDEPVAMPKLCAKTNRFVAAGIFFELMVLSKEEAVELVQGENLQITNISMRKMRKLEKKTSWKTIS